MIRDAFGTRWPKSWPVLIALLFLFLGQGPLIAQESTDDLLTVVLRDRNAVYSVGRRILVLRDQASGMSLTDVVNAPNLFERSRQQTPNYGYSSAVFWAKFRVANETEFEEWLLEYAYPHVDSVRLYVVSDRDGSVVMDRLFGDHFDFVNREYEYRNFINRILFKRNGTFTCYMRIATSGSIQIPIKIYSETRLIAKINAESKAFGVYYGAMMIMGFYNLFLFFSVRSRSYLYYVAYIMSYTLMNLALNGFAFEHLWPGSPQWANTSMPFMVSLSNFFALAFSSSFLQMKEVSRKLQRAFVFLMSVSVLLAAASFDLPYRISIRGSVALSFVSSVFILVAGSFALSSGFRPARFFLLAWLALLVGIIFYPLQANGLIPTSFITEYSQQIGSLLEVALLSFALADRINVMKTEKEQAQRETITQRTLLLEASARFVPKPFLNFLGRESIVEAKLGDQIETEITILFTDIRDFTALSESMTPAKNFAFINALLSHTSPVITDNKGFIDKYLGDAIMALFPDEPENAILAGIQLKRKLEAFNQTRLGEGLKPIEIGIGINTGNAILGTIGYAERMDTTVISDAVNLASRLEGITKIYGADMVVSEQTLLRIPNPSRFHFRILDRIKVKGKNEPVSVFEFLEGREGHLPELKMQTKEDFENGIRLYQENDFRGAAESFRLVLSKNPDDVAAQLHLTRCIHFDLHGPPPDWQGVAIMENK